MSVVKIQYQYGVGSIVGTSNFIGQCQVRVPIIVIGVKHTLNYLSRSCSMPGLQGSTKLSYKNPAISFVVAYINLFVVMDFF